MSKPYLEITYRRGKPFAAYLYLDRSSGDRVEKTRREGRVQVDFNASGQAIGIEITSIVPGVIDDVAAAIRRAGLASVDPAELAPLQAA